MAFLLRSRNSRSLAAPGFGAGLDFVNGTYTVNGETVTAADVISDTDRISGDGLSILAGFGNKLDFLGAFRDLLFVRNWTVVMELDLLAAEAPTPSHQNTLLYLANADESRYLDVKTDAEWPDFDEWDGTVNRHLSPDNQHGVGINRIAVTRTPDLASMSMNGETATTEDTTITDIEYSIAETAWHNKSNPAGFIRSIEIMSPVGPSSLPALSAI